MDDDEKIVRGRQNWGRRILPLAWLLASGDGDVGGSQRGVVPRPLRSTGGVFGVGLWGNGEPGANVPALQRAGGAESGMARWVAVGRGHCPVSGTPSGGPWPSSVGDSGRRR